MMKQGLFVLLVMGCAVNAFAQNKQPAKQPDSKEVTTVKTTTTTVASDVDLLGGETFNVIDATPLKTGTIDLRLAGRYKEATGTVTHKQSTSLGRKNTDADDNQWIMTPEIVWGAKENFELHLAVPTWVDNSWNIPGQPDGNYDTYIGSLWNFYQQEDWWPSMAIGTRTRLPTGEHSNGIDTELRLSMTNEYESGLRSHLNFFGKVVNGDNIENSRNIQYGAVAGLDGPLCADGAVRWVFDYMYQISDVDGGGRSNSAEAGWQWQMADAHKLGMSVQAGLDHSDETTPDEGAVLTYSYTITY
jgi:hypothetical protein